MGDIIIMARNISGETKHPACAVSQAKPIDRYRP
jgi:hypothetical protein